VAEEADENDQGDGDAQQKQDDGSHVESLLENSGLAVVRDDVAAAFPFVKPRR
jgi:hypothetical protein